jgi:hypothetical protein
MGSVLTCSMIAMILLGASILGSAAAFLGIPRAIADFVAGMGLSPFMLIVALIIFYLILGCFLDGFSMIVLTLADRAADREAGRIRSGLVRHLPGAGGRDGADHPAGRVQPVRDPGADRRRARLYRQGDAAVPDHHGAVHAGHHGVSGIALFLPTGSGRGR